MAKIPGLLLRRRTYYSRIFVPKDLLSSFDRDQIWESLGTADRREAEVLHLQKSAYWKAAFIEARKSLPGPSDGTNASASCEDKPLPLSQTDIARLARTFFVRRKSSLDEREITSAELAEEEREAVESDLQQQLSTLATWQNPDTHHWVGKAEAEALEVVGLSPPIDPVASQRLSELLRRALIQLCTIELARVHGDFRDQVTDELFQLAPGTDQDLSNFALGQGTTLGKCIERFLKEALDLKPVTEKTSNKHRSLLSHIEAFFGADTRLIVSTIRASRSGRVSGPETCVSVRRISL